MGSLQIDPGGTEARGSSWDRCRLIPEGSHTVAGGRRAAAHPRNECTNAVRSRRDRRHVCDRVAVGGLAHVRGPGVFAALKPPATVCDRVAVGGREFRWDQAKAASASFSASGIRTSPEMSFGRRVSRSSEQACHGMGTLNSWSMKTLGTKPLSLRLKRLGTFSSRCFESTQISLTSAKMTLA